MKAAIGRVSQGQRRFFKEGTMKANKKTRGEINRRGFLKVSAAAGAAAAVSGFPTVLRAQPPAIKIGSVQPATGPLAVIGQGQRKGAQMAVEYINSRGGIKSMGGAKLELLLGDSQTSPEVGRSESDRLIKDGAKVIVGAFESGTGMAIATLCEQRGMPFVCDVATLDDITQKGYKYTFRVFPTSTTFAQKMIEFLQTILTEKKISPKRVVVSYVGDTFGKTQGALFIKHFKEAKLGMEIVEEISYPLGVPDLSAEVAKIKAAKPDILFPICRPGDSTIMTRELFKQKVEMMGIVSPGSPGWYEPSVIKDLDKLILYVMDNVPWINPESPVYKAANELFLKNFNAYMETNNGYAYTGILVTADALERAKSTDPDKIVEALKATDFKDHPMVGDAVKFAPNGDNINATTAMIQILPDADPLKRVKVVLPKKFAQADYVFPAPQLWDRG
jgi:branched-chain amino acid transport system substrate-binding protein